MKEQVQLLDKVSIVIPVYEVEKYISQCIDSVIKQDYKNWELILVDDGSTDQSGKICDEYALRDKRIIVIHKQNGGVSSARNTGIENATGKYLMFIDGDDWIEAKAISNLIHFMKENCVDVCLV